MKKITVIAVLLLALVFAVGVTADKLITSATPAVRALLDVTNATAIAEGNPANLSRLRGLTTELTTLDGEKLIKIVVKSSTDATANRIELSSVGSIVGYEYMRIRLKNDSADVMTVTFSFGTPASGWQISEAVLTDKTGAITAEHTETPSHQIPANFDGYVFLKMTKFRCVSGGLYHTRTADSSDALTVSTYVLTATNVASFELRFTGTVDSAVYFGDIVLCGADVQPDATTAPPTTPPTTAPETTAPETTEPETTAPETTEPETTEPETTEPETTEPETTEPATAAPDTDNPETGAPVIIGAVITALSSAAYIVNRKRKA